MKRNKIIDLMKSIGILLVVIGHCSKNIFLNRFIYIFHLPLFFLISGYLYNEKNSKEPWNFVGQKIKKFVTLYILYGSFLVVFRNIFIQMGILNVPKYKLGDIIIGILNSCLFQSIEPFSAAMWFIPILLVSLIVYNFITNLVINIKDSKEKEIKRTIIILLITILGIYLNNKNYNIGLHYQTVFVIMPFIHLGQIIKLYFKDKLYPNLLVSFITIIITILCLLKLNGGVELSINQIWNPFIFYVLGSLLIYVVYTICFYLDKFSKIASIFEYIGKNTFQIMCLHIVSFKVLDYIVINCFTKNYVILSNFTISYEKLFIGYIIIGITLPLIFVYLLKKLKEYVNNLLKKINTIKN